MRSGTRTVSESRPPFPVGRCFGRTSPNENELPHGGQRCPLRRAGEPASQDVRARHGRGLTSSLAAAMRAASMRSLGAMASHRKPPAPRVNVARRVTPAKRSARVRLPSTGHAVPDYCVAFRRWFAWPAADTALKKQTAAVRALIVVWFDSGVPCGCLHTGRYQANGPVIRGHLLMIMTEGRLRG